jgi:very-short-patch-repair endonuclease
MTLAFNKRNIKEKRRNLRNNQTETEARLWKYLRKEQLGVKFRRQYSIGEYIVDFYSTKLKLAIELDGSQHYTNDRREYDEIRENFMLEHGIKTIRFISIL